MLQPKQLYPIDNRRLAVHLRPKCRDFINQRISCKCNFLGRCPLRYAVHCQGPQACQLRIQFVYDQSMKVGQTNPIAFWPIAEIIHEMHQALTVLRLPENCP